MNTRPLSVKTRFEGALADANRRLASLAIVRGRPISLKGIRGWIFEQTVRTCLEEEMEKRSISVAVQEQAPIGGRATVDLLIASVAIEVKVAGFFADVSARYRGYRKAVEAKGWHYFYLTLGESYERYVKIARRTFGKDRAFFLDQKGDWARFVSEVMRILKRKEPKTALGPTATAPRVLD
ncbi:MAG TPA: hypothetical protein VN765_11285 [Candidatus Acidoferrum sp.]|nr:hypothetical protein [Candidatus Acidoferrum sp.]